MLISIIAAVSENNVIGNKSSIPWLIKNDLKRFKNLTLGKCLIMGHKTFNSIKKELTGRKVIVLSTQKNLNYTNCFIANSINEVIELCINDNEIFIAGGGQIYSQFINIAHKIYLTRVHTFIQGDTFFPEINQS
ncbi:MAG TPA: dihydrofolate reductase, partial [Bacteroidales bacterium]|nr:dihydrofolate reductase [Bacteroidales bacterium]